jgi:hypothetical protein
LDMLSDNGVRYSVVEGFKTVPFRKVVIGDLDTPALFRNPSVSDIIALLPMFDDYYTLAGLKHEIEGEPGPGLFYSRDGYIGVPLSRDHYTRLEEEITCFDGITGVRIGFNTLVYQGFTRFYIVIRAEIPGSGILALARCEQAISMETDNPANSDKS